MFISLFGFYTISLVIFKASRFIVCSNKVEAKIFKCSKASYEMSPYIYDSIITKEKL